jgi:hypothetical protein
MLLVQNPKPIHTSLPLLLSEASISANRAEGNVYRCVGPSCSGLLEFKLDQGRKGKYLRCYQFSLGFC